MMYDTILLPIDGSEGSDAAATHAIDLANTYDATLHGLVVVDQSTYVGIENDIRREEIREEQREASEALLDDLGDELDEADVDYELDTANGVPGERIPEYATENDVDLIVMGTRGRSGLDRLLLGSTTEKVLRSVDIPVHCVPLRE